jgi:hypothetical protein
MASSDGYPLVHCHARGCDYSSINSALIKAGVPRELLRPAHGDARPHERSKPALKPPHPGSPFVPDSTWMPWVQNLTTEQLNALRNRRGLKAKTLRSELIGWSPQHRRFTIPVFDKDGQCVNVRLYDPKPRASSKMINLKGYGNRLFVPGDLLEIDRTTLYCAGEWDALMAVEHGWQAVSHTGGEGAHVPEVDKHRLRGHDVVVIYDLDEAGIKGARRVAADLAGVARRVSIAQLPDDLGDKGDLSDLFRQGRGTELRQVVANAMEVGVDAHEDADLGSWAPQPLADVLSEDYEPLLPTIGRRAGNGIALFYPGLLHTVIAESEAGKTWLALHVAMQEMVKGEVVFYFDFEDSKHGIVQRLMAMGCPPEVIERQFRYARPDEPFDRVRDGVTAQLRREKPSLAIVDGVTEVMIQNRWRQKENDDIAQFYQLMLRPMTDTGAAVVTLDHLPKSEEGSAGRGGIGGVHKLNGIDGAAYRLKPVQVIAKGKQGLSQLTIDKDRHGEVKRHQEDGKAIADLIVDAEGEGDEVAVSLELPRLSAEFIAQREARNNEKKEREDAEVRAFVEGFVAENPGPTRNRILLECGEAGLGKKAKIGRILDTMTDPDQFGTLIVRPGPNKSQQHFLAEGVSGVPVS